ncbi:MAG: thioredoxin-disulfide reductase [Nitrospiraceae bacterium]|nr:MAG: thioredoxin-disulfide reductase [Nitrospiraceae bacterium]
MHDVIIIGGGPAGLTAGLYTSRARLKSLLIEKGLTGGTVTITEWIENYPGFEEGVAGTDLARKMEQQATKFGLEITQGTVIRISFNGNIKKVILEDGQEIESKSVILASGGHPRKLKIEGEDEFRGKGVSYCATCDGAFFKGAKIAVIGGGDSAVQEGLFLTKFAEVVYIVHRRDNLRAEKILQDRAFSDPKIKLVWDSVPEKIEGDEKGVTSLLVKNVKTGELTSLEVEGVFIYIGFDPNTEFLAGTANLDENNYIITDENLATSAPGIFAAGDMRSKITKQIATAVGDGAIAAIAAEKYIEDNFKK